MEFKNRLKDVDKLQKEIDVYRPLGPGIVKQLKEYYRIGLTYSSNALEGNTLSEIETKVILEDGITIGGKSMREHQEVLGHSEAYDRLYTMYESKEITENEIKEFHRLFYQRIKQETAGTYRQGQVIITGSDYLPPPGREVPDLMKRLVNRIPAMREKYHPVEFAALLHKDFVEIHPFEDGNGRTARLLMNLALLQDGYVIAVIPPVIKADYIRCLQESNNGNDRPFVHLISSMVYESQKDYLRLLKHLVPHSC